MTLPLFPDDAMALPDILPARRLKGRVTAALDARGGDFLTEPAASLEMDINGIKGDFHAGPTRKSGGREPWYPRGTEIRNERQLSIVATDELALAAALMGIERIEPGWIGANLVLDGFAQLSMLPPRTQLFFEGGVTLRIDGDNGPCRLAGAAIARNYPDIDQTALELGFVKAAKRRRGVVAWVEKPGVIHTGESVTAHIWEQWIYAPV
ncbi:molybdenum cofactor sulfurase [Hoeflea sp. YIM 152468]|uniref:MOSC domain-containing protein n=1 Tax=Hoeflea sp. YIM 152468 TaxID=3031759 RepID=UPI0023DA087D|nr:MOSC domain-containing protein [Hoeflea sp. YIM 152468]MDF1609607.1 molybdenum cofactor sulfurase [Hoeflea sp. YIM 152468]